MPIKEFNFVINAVAVVFQGLLWLIFMYYLVISVFGWFRRKEVPASEFSVKNKFAVIISAYNEETVIGEAVRSLKRLNYPRDMYDIYVIADNCSDNTAKIASENGAKVYERFDLVRKGKGHSLEWMFRKLFECGREYDAICILDADNLVSFNFLMEMNKHLCMGHKVIQGYLDSKNPQDTWVSGNYSIAYWISNRLFQLPRYYLGLSCALGGTGFVMSMDVLKSIGWGATCLTEDLEFSLKLALNGMRVHWSHDAVIYDEKPLKLKQSWGQRRRWMQGHCDCAGRYLRKLFIKAVKDRDFVALDLVLYLVQPFFIVTNGINFVISLIVTLISTDYSKLFTLNSLLFVGLFFVLTYINIVFVIVEGKFTRHVAKYFLLFPFYNLTWVPIIIQGFLNRKERVWVHTIHTRSLDINEIESLEQVG